MGPFSGAGSAKGPRPKGVKRVAGGDLGRHCRWNLDSGPHDSPGQSCFLGGWRHRPWKKSGPATGKRLRSCRETPCLSSHDHSKVSSQTVIVGLLLRSQARRTHDPFFWWDWVRKLRATDDVLVHLSWPSTRKHGYPRLTLGWSLTL